MFDEPATTSPDRPSAPDSTSPTSAGGAETTSPRAILRRLGLLTPLAVISATLPAIGGITLLAFAGPVGQWLRSQGSSGPLIYVAGFAGLAGLALLPTYAQAVIGGFAFRFWTGAPAALAGFGGAALVGYGVARLAGGDRAVQVISEKPRWRAVYDALLGGGFWRTLGIITLVRVPPNSPFAITNLVFAATKVSLPTYVIGTLLGMAPRTIAAVYIGSTVHDLPDPARPKWLIIAGIASIVVVVLIIGQIANHALTRVTNANKQT
jgi:uncharacterized membrane protein YdjX (TVP38/TMEM64 family)